MSHCTRRHTAGHSAGVASTPRRGLRCRRGAAMVELALITPLLVFLLLAGMDYSRVFYAAVVVSNCARNGALYASDPNVADRSSYDTLQDAVLADATDLPAQLQVSSTEGIDAAGYGWVEVTVVYPFQ